MCVCLHIYVYCGHIHIHTYIYPSIFYIYIFMSRAVLMLYNTYNYRYHGLGHGFGVIYCFIFSTTCVYGHFGSSHLPRPCVEFFFPTTRPSLRTSSVLGCTHSFLLCGHFFASLLSELITGGASLISGQLYLPSALHFEDVHSVGTFAFPPAGSLFLVPLLSDYFHLWAISDFGQTSAFGFALQGDF